MPLAAKAEQLTWENQNIPAGLLIVKKRSFDNLLLEYG